VADGRGIGLAQPRPQTLRKKPRKPDHSEAIAELERRRRGQSSRQPTDMMDATPEEIAQQQRWKRRQK